MGCTFFLRVLKKGHSKGEHRGTFFICSTPGAHWLRVCGAVQGTAHCPCVGMGDRVTLVRSQLFFCIFIINLLCNRKGKENMMGSEVSPHFCLSLIGTLRRLIPPSLLHEWAEAVWVAATMAFSLHQWLCVCLCAQATFLKICSLSAVLRLDHLGQCDGQSSNARHQAHFVLSFPGSKQPWQVLCQSDYDQRE